MASIADLIGVARQYLGVPYVYGGTTPQGFDCSGFVQYVFARVGIKLPRTSQDQAKTGQSIPETSLQPGDLVFSDWGDGPDSHVALYVGSGQIIEAPRSGETVRLLSLDSGYRSHVSRYRRVIRQGQSTIQAIESFGSGIADSLLGDTKSGLSGLISLPSELLGFYKAAGSGLNSAAELAAAFFRPSTYVRIGAGFFGVMFLIAGCVFLLMGARET